MDNIEDINIVKDMINLENKIYNITKQLDETNMDILAIRTKIQNEIMKKIKKDDKNI